MKINQAQNDKDLEQMLKPALRYAVQYVVDKIYHENQIAINEVVYGKYVGDYYENSFEFDRAWDTAVHDTQAVKHTVEGDFFYAPSKMGVQAAGATENHLGQHMSFDGKDVREYLADIIYEGLAANPNSAIHGGNKANAVWAKKRNAFELLVERIGKKNLRQWMREGMELYGLNVKTYSNVGIKREKIE